MAGDVRFASAWFKLTNLAQSYTIAPVCLKCARRRAISQIIATAESDLWL
jgi:hypothetical protein